MKWNVHISGTIVSETQEPTVGMIDIRGSFLATRGATPKVGSVTKHEQFDFSFSTEFDDPDLSEEKVIELIKENITVRSRTEREMNVEWDGYDESVSYDDTEFWSFFYENALIGSIEQQRFGGGGEAPEYSISVTCDEDYEPSEE